VTNQLPFSAVVFTPGALLSLDAPAEAPDRSRPGARRLVGALVRQGIRVSVVVDPADPLGRGEVMARLGDAGMGGLPVLDTSTRPGQPAGTALELVLTAPERTLVVMSPSDPPPGDDAGTVAGTVTMTRDLPAAAPVACWLAARMRPFAAARLMVTPPDETAAMAAAERHQSLTKPPGSLGRLEELGVQLSAIAGRVPPPLPRPAAVAVFAGDHGVHAQGVSPWPQEVTAQMVANFVDGGAAVNVLARQMGATVTVVDVGVAGDLPAARGLVDRKVARGTADLAIGPAMTADQAAQALDAGAEVALRLVAGGARCLLTGDMGIANTTASAALIGALTGRRAGDITGPGAGLPSAQVPRKATIVAGAAARARERHGEDAFGILAEVGGLEHAALVGFIVAGAAAGVPVVVDGVIAASALLVATRLVPGVQALTIAGHRSVEPGSRAVLQTLDMAPVVDLDLRLGEGTGAVLALPLVEAAARVLAEMATFDQAGVSSKGSAR
jgi:nicotinate-nucleotide--dimethylbenzimidazole phosphoribosyltransferase